MADGNSSVRLAPVIQSVVTSVTNSAYICLIALLLAAIGIKYQGMATNPFQESSAIVFIFLIATFCHAVALKAISGTETCWPTSTIAHVSGVTACEALLWVLVPQFLLCFIINVLMLLVVTLILSYKDICGLLIKCCRPNIIDWEDVVLDIENQMVTLDGDEGIDDG